jgi:hypothetical protein
MPLQCRRCCNIFDNEAQLTDHSRSSNSCVITDIQPIDGFDKDQERNPEVEGECPELRPKNTSERLHTSFCFWIRHLPNSPPSVRHYTTCIWLAAHELIDYDYVNEPSPGQ